jgi:hypothetical protein
VRYYRSDEASIHVGIAGVTIDDESWDMLDGFDLAAENKEIFPGGGPQVSLGGIPKRSTGTVERDWSDTLFTVFKTLENSINNLVTVSYVINEAPGKPQGTVFTYTGPLLSATRPGYKSGETGDAMLKLLVGANGGMS